MRTLTEADRLKLALAGRRRLGQQTLEIILTGYASLEKADQEVRKRLPQLIIMEDSSRPVPGKS